MSKPTHHIELLSKKDIDLLTQLLDLTHHTPPSPTWLHDQRVFIANLPASLLRPTALLPRLAMSFTASIPSLSHLPFNYTAPQALLCPAHKDLNPWLIRRLFVQVSAECTTRARRLAARGRRLGVAADVAAWLRRLQAINSLWMAPELYRVAFAVQPEEARFERVESGCEACILAVVGGKRQVVADLRSAVLSRKRKHRPLPRMLAVLDGWVGWSGDAEGIREESNALAKEIRAIRRDIRRERKARRQRREDVRNGVVKSDNTLPIDEPEDLVEADDELGEALEGHPDQHDQYDQDFENSISFYANLMSNISLAHPTDPTSSTQALVDETLLHPAFRESIVFSPTTETFRSNRSQEHATRRQTFYTQSAYSGDSGFGGSLDAQKAEKWAEAYRNLVGIPEHAEDDGEQRDELDHDGNEMRFKLTKSKTRSTESTQWGDLYR